MEVKCACIVAKNDRLVSHSHVEAFRRLAPLIEVVEISGPHFILQTNPNECAQVLKKILAL